MVRAIFEHGVIRPLDALPSYWADGQELVVDEVGDRSSPEDLERWAREMDVLAAEIPPEDFERLEEALEQADREAKAHVRRLMGIA